jgi:hypothetical protein
MMANYHQQMQAIFAQYAAEVSPDPADLREVGAWALRQGLWHPRPADIQTRFANEMAEALREEYRTDSAGRRYRANLAVRATKDGRQMSLWGDIDTAPRSHVEKAVGQRRKQIVGDCWQLRMDADHYSDAHPDEERIQLVLDFNDDVEEMMIAAGIDEKKAA